VRRRGNARRADRWLTAGVGSVGLTSFFSDSGHEMVTAILPSFVTTVLGGSAAWLGLIDGFSDALTGVTKVIGGPLADDAQRRARTASGGYLATAVATALIALATAVWQVGVLRAIAWAARGFRSPARDSMLAALAKPGARGRAFGVERAGDNLGAVVGPLLAGLLIGWIGIRPTIGLSIVPGVLAAVAITIAAAAARRTAPATASGPRPRLFAGYRRLRGTGIGRALVPAAFLECGNLAATLLILRANGLLVGAGLSTTAAVAVATVLYAVHNAVAAGTSLIAGSLADRFGPRVTLGAGALVYAVAYAGFALTAGSWGAVLVFFALGGCGIGLAETAESTLVAQRLPDELRGSGFGVLGLVQAGGDLVATVVGGALYTFVSPAACFVYAAAWMVLALLASAIIRERQADRPPTG
jgi:MFS family permease